MDHSTSVSTETNEQNLTPGEQRILAVLDQRMDRVDQRMDRVDQQLKELTRKVELEAAESKTRDRSLSYELQHLRGAVQQQDLNLRDTLHKEMNTLRNELWERLDQHDTRMKVLERTVEQNCEAIGENSKALVTVQQDLRKLTATVEALVEVSPRQAPVEQRPTS
jgi:chromosome segregation ATPase